MDKKEYRRWYWEKNKEKINKERRERYKNDRKERERICEKQRTYRESHKEKIYKYQKRWNDKNRERLNAMIKKSITKHRERHKARCMVNKRVGVGTLPTPSSFVCPLCGARAEQYHHVDYSKPLLLFPLCCGCHAKLHRKYEVGV